jgi:hypothetical protein
LILENHCACGHCPSLRILDTAELILRIPADVLSPQTQIFRVSGYTGWSRETGKFEIIRKKRRKLTKLYLILKMCSTRVEISLGINFEKLCQLSAVHGALEPKMFLAC